MRDVAIEGSGVCSFDYISYQTSFLLNVMSDDKYYTGNNISLKLSLCRQSAASLLGDYVS